MEVAADHRELMEGGETVAPEKHGARRFEGRVAVVTGAGGGIGEAYSRGFAREGAAVAVIDIDEVNISRVATQISEAGGSALAIAADVGDPDAVRDAAQSIDAAFGRIDVLVNNAGVYREMSDASLLDIPLGDWQQFFDVSVTGALLCTRAVVPLMGRHGGGTILNQSSTSAYMGSSAYGIAKLAQNGLTNALARQLAGRGIRVNGMAPGPIDTPATRARSSAGLERIVAELPLGRIGRPDDLVEAALFLCSDDAAWITGVILNVDGGQIMRP